MSQLQSPPVRQRSPVNRCEYLQLVTRRCLADAWIGTYMQKAHICRRPTRLSAGALWTIAHSSVIAYCSSSPLDRLSWRPVRSPGAPTAIRTSAGAGSFVSVEIIGGAKRGRIHRLSDDHEENSNRAGDCRSCRAGRLWRHGLGDAEQLRMHSPPVPRACCGRPPAPAGGETPSRSLLPILSPHQLSTMPSSRRNLRARNRSAPSKRPCSSRLRGPRSYIYWTTC